MDGGSSGKGLLPSMVIYGLLAMLNSSATIAKAVGNGSGIEV